MRLLLSLICMMPFVGFSAPLPADDLFKLEAKVQDPNTLVLNWQIKKNYFLYHDKLRIKSLNDEVTVGNISFPPAETKTFKDGKSYKVYRHSLNLTVPVLTHLPGDESLEVRYQGCADDGFCYPPEKKNILLRFNSQNELVDAKVDVVSSPKPIPSSKTMNSSEKTYDAYFSEKNFILTVLGFLGFGLLLSMTPCVLPMVPVLSGLIVGHGKDITVRKSFFLSLSYVLSMSLTYALIGAVVALMGNNLQVMMQSPWTVSVFALIFVLLSLSMFGFYELQLPLSWQNKMASVTRSQSSGHYFSAAIMGCLSTLILSPCVTAPMVGALGYIAHTGNVVLGVTALFFLGFGMGMPLLLIGLSAGRILPKAGHWMNEVKSFFGVLLIAMAIYLLQRIIPATMSMALWGSLLIFCGNFLGAFSLSVSKLDKFNQSLGIICVVYGVLILIGGTLGSDNPLKPLATINMPTQSVMVEPVKIATSLDDIKKTIAQTDGRPVILDFYADWCATCKSIEKTILNRPEVQAALKSFVFLKVDVTRHDKDAKAILSYFNVIAPPTFIFIDSSGKEMNTLRLNGDISTQQLMTNIHRL